MRTILVNTIAFYRTESAAAIYRERERSRILGKLGIPNDFNIAHMSVNMP
jgi:hypothetical protein